MVDSSSTKYTKAPPLRVWDVLCDGYRYAEWVQGTKEIRSVDEGFPATGTAIHFTAGVGPLTYKNQTTVKDVVELQSLELEAHGWPAGSVLIRIRIEPDGEGCNLTMEEHPLKGPARWLHNPATKVAFNVRTSMILNNLIKLAESDTPVNQGSEPEQPATTEPPSGEPSSVPPTAETQSEPPSAAAESAPPATEAPSGDGTVSDDDRA